MNEIEQITFEGDDGEEIQYYVLEQTRLNGYDYIIVVDNMDDEEAEAFIMKDISRQEEAEAVYEFVDDENELLAIGKVFVELLEDVDLDI